MNEQWPYLLATGLEALFLVAYFLIRPAVALVEKMEDRRAERLRELRAAIDREEWVLRKALMNAGGLRAVEGRRPQWTIDTARRWARLRMPQERKVALIRAHVPLELVGHYREHSLEDLRVIAALSYPTNPVLYPRWGIDRIDMDDVII